jgi:hypothetical protein
MTMNAKEQQARVDAQVASWMAELRRESSRLAGQIAAATGKQYAFVLMSGTDADYADVIPELLLEDALRVVPPGWPAGIEFEVLNPASA